MTRKEWPPLGARQIRNRMARYLKLAGITKRYAPIRFGIRLPPNSSMQGLAGGGQRTHGAPFLR